MNDHEMNENSKEMQQKEIDKQITQQEQKERKLQKRFSDFYLISFLLTWYVTIRNIFVQS